MAGLRAVLRLGGTVRNLDLACLDGPGKINFIGFYADSMAVARRWHLFRLMVQLVSQVRTNQNPKNE
jgi:hypothetical protein